MGNFFDVQMLDIKEDQLLAAFAACSSRVAALSLAIGYPTVASLPHLISHTFRKLVALTLSTDYSFEEAKKFKEMAANPAAAAASVAASAAEPVTAPAAEAAAPAAETKKPEEPPPEEDANIGSLFD